MSVRRDIKAYMAEHGDGCKHPRTRLSRKQFSNGTWHFVRQCENCWAQVGNYLKKEEAAKEIKYFDDVPIFDEEASERAVEDDWAARNALFQEARSRENAEWWQRYTAYLKTDAWRSRSALVRKRNPTCEGCGLRPSTQAHHLTYKHVCNEFLWELVAVCDACHERAHELKQDAP